MSIQTLCLLFHLFLIQWHLLTHISAAHNNTTSSVPLPHLKFSKRVICPSDQCNFNDTVPWVHSRLGCMASCFQHNAVCRGVSFNQSCFHLDDVCFSTSACQQQTPQVSAMLAVYEKHQMCLNGGKWNTTVGQCRCQGGWVGPNCGVVARSCRELQESGYPPDFYPVMLNIRNNTPPVPRKVYCTLSTDNSVFTYMFRSTGKEDHNRTWSDFTEGYVINDGNLWLGLDNMATLSATSDYSIVGVSVILRSSGSQRTFSLLYPDFYIGDYQTQYRYTVPTLPKYASTGELGPAYSLTDIFGPNQNTPFSTRDQDNDSDSANNCAALAGAGWWFKSCDTWTPSSLDRINPLGWTAEAKPINDTDDLDLLGLPGLDFEDPVMQGSFLVINVYFYQPPP